VAQALRRVAYFCEEAAMAATMAGAVRQYSAIRLGPSGSRGGRGGSASLAEAPEA